ncbi:serine/threonine-protein kinase fhke-related [Anaeramoeba ignava]|uniref:Serine/threonine-protein kinase fhke-related n=1 Tax=Anaeramoeba ignava TaxID=1746090 RepID=A0A9Q0LA79_ANAIG|nr:serine/threonine-protein kinase fhke-related [Anaeramoeba ignava]
METDRKGAWGELVSLTKKHPNFLLKGDDPITIGRLKTCSFRIKDRKMSGVHCSIQRVKNESNDLTPYNVVIKDLSANGTFINGQRLGKGNEKELLHSYEISFVFPRGRTIAEPVGAFRFTDFEIVPPDHIEDTTILEHYEIKQQLGVGKFAIVRLGIKRETGEKFAVKIIDKKKCFNEQSARSGRDKMMDEVNVLKRIKHENIVCITEIYNTDNYIFLVLELCTGGELFDKIIAKGKYTEEESRQVTKQILSVVKYLHNQNIAHRDLKPENILLVSQDDDTNIKVADFGLSRFFSDSDKLVTFAGTPQYLAPEVIRSANRDGYGKACDMWSVGVILYILITGYMPFASENQNQLLNQILNGEVEFPDSIFQGVTLAARNLIRRCLTVDPEKRITAEEALQHPWILGKSQEIKDEFQNVEIHKKK